MSNHLTRSRIFVLNLLISSFLLLVFAQPGEAQSCGAPTIPASYGTCAPDWLIGSPQDFNESGGINPVMCNTNYSQLSAWLTAYFENSLTAQNPTCTFTWGATSTANSAFEVPFSFAGCSTYVYGGYGPYHSPTNSSALFAQLETTYFCATSGYTYVSGQCVATSPELFQCSGPNQAGAAGVTTPVNSKTDGESSCCTAGNPINVATGNKFQKEVDFPAVTSDALSFARYYNSDVNVPVGSIGANWRGTFDRSVVLSNDPSFGGTYTGPLLALAFRPDGRVITFNISGATPTATDPDTVETLSQPTSTTWALTTRDDTVEIYTTVHSVKTTGPSNFAQLSSVQFRSGVLELMTYNAAQNLTVVKDSFGQSLTFSYDSSNRLSSMTDTAGNLYGYQYSGKYLSIALFPGPTMGSLTGAPSRSYAYNAYSSGGTSIPYLLTGITDESANSYATWAYATSVPYVGISSYHGSSSTKADLSNLGSYSTTAGTGTTVTDGNGQSSVYTFQVINGVPKYTSIVSNGTLTQSATYDTSDNVISATDRGGNITTYQYNSRNLETSRTEASNSSAARTIATQWHPTYHLPTQISVYAGTSASGTPLSNSFFIYDSFGNLTSKTLSDPINNVSRTWTYTYDSFGHVLTAIGPRTDVLDETQFAYNACTTGYGCGRVSSVTDSAGHITTYNSYNADGFPLSITDPNGIATTITYDNRNRVTSRTVGSETTSIAYLPTGLVSQVTMPDGSYLSYTYDTAHRLTQVADGAGNKITYTLSTMGNRTAENSYDPSGTLDKKLTRVFDTLGRLSGLYGAAGTSAVETTFAYDNDNNPLTVAAPLSRTSHATYDQLNRVLTSTNAAGGVSANQYNALDQVTAITDPNGLITGYSYDALGDLLQLSSPDTGSTSYTYDSGGNVASVTDARGVSANYAYDVLNRPTTASFVSGGSADQTITFVYDAAANTQGRLTSASDANHSMVWGYDGLGRVTSKTQVIGGLSSTVSYLYTNSDLVQLTTPSGQVITYTYSDNHVAGITVNGTSLLTAASYEPFGPVRGWTWGNGSTETRSYNTDGNPSNFGGTELYTYSYDNAFRITGIADGSNSALSYTYGYDAIDRLTSATRSGSTLGWSYDANSNRLAQTGSAESYSYGGSSNKLNAITGGLTRSYSYDAVGNTVADTAAQFTYNNRGRMSSSTVGTLVTTYVYNALGERIEKNNASNTEYFVYDEAGHLLGEYGSGGALIQETVWLGDTPVATIQPSGSGVSIFNIHADHLNTPRNITNANGVVVWRWDLDPFGTAVANVNPSGLGAFAYNLRLPGQYADAETGLNYNFRRDYDPATGRYLESDPVGLKAGVNTYVYSLENPILDKDPFGLTTLAFGLQGSAASYGLAAGSFQFAVSWNPAALKDTKQWQLGWIASGTLGGSSGIGFQAGVIGTYSRAVCIKELDGWSSTFGGSAGEGYVVGLDVGGIEDSGPSTYNLSGGIGAKLSPEILMAPGEVHAAASKTATGSISLYSLTHFWQ